VSDLHLQLAKACENMVFHHKVNPAKFQTLEALLKNSGPEG